MNVSQIRYFLELVKKEAFFLLLSAQGKEASPFYLSVNALKPIHDFGDHAEFAFGIIIDPV